MALFDSFTLIDNLRLPLERFTTNSKGEVDSLIQKRLDDVCLGEDRTRCLRISQEDAKEGGPCPCPDLDPCIFSSMSRQAGLIEYRR